MTGAKAIRRKIVGQIDVLDVVEEAPNGKTYHVVKLRFMGEEYYITELDKLLQRIRKEVGDFLEEVPEGETP